MNPTVYLDATIPSFYYEDRPGTIMQAWREVTVQFWEYARGRYDLVVSDETISELEDDRYPREKREKCLALVDPLHCLKGDMDIAELAAYYVQNSAMPRSDVGDAMHLAFATWYRVEYLLTWNYKHLANANKYQHIETLNARRRLNTPRIVTPGELMEFEPC